MKQKIECSSGISTTFLVGEAETLREFAKVNKTNLSGAKLSGADLSRANLSRANLFRANLFGANLTKACLTGADLTKADLTGANLTGADLTGADLTAADLVGADLKGADLTGADLTRADLKGADLTGADLTRADLVRADLTGADLTGADLTEADLTEADLSEAIMPAGEKYVTITQKEACKLTIEWWNWLKKTNSFSKQDWPEYQKYLKQWPNLSKACFLCLASQEGTYSNCERCPLPKSEAMECAIEDSAWEKFRKDDPACYDLIINACKKK